MNLHFFEREDKVVPAVSVVSVVRNLLVAAVAAAVAGFSQRIVLLEMAVLQLRPQTGCFWNLEAVVAMAASASVVAEAAEAAGIKEIPWHQAGD